MTSESLDPTSGLQDTSFALINWAYQMQSGVSFTVWAFSAVQIRVLLGKATPDELKAFHELNTTLRHLSAMVDATANFRGHLPVRI